MLHLELSKAGLHFMAGLDYWMGAGGDASLAHSERAPSVAPGSSSPTTQRSATRARRCIVREKGKFPEVFDEAIHIVLSNPDEWDDVRQDGCLDCLQRGAECLGAANCTGRTRSWCLEHCCGWLRDHLKKGHDLYSHGRSRCRVELQEECDELCFQAREARLDDSQWRLVEARSLLSELRRRLGPRDQSILDLLAEGCGQRQIAEKLGITQPAVSKHWRKIVAVARVVDAIPGIRNACLLASRPRRKF